MSEERTFRQLLERCEGERDGARREASSLRWHHARAEIDRRTALEELDAIKRDSAYFAAKLEEAEVTGNRYANILHALILAGKLEPTTVLTAAELEAPKSDTNILMLWMPGDGSIVVSRDQVR